jgi:hypothetical protein
MRYDKTIEELESEKDDLLQALSMTDDEEQIELIEVELDLIEAEMECYAFED